MDGNDLANISQETLDLVKKATTAGLLSGSGVLGIDLQGLVSLVPVNTPTRNSIGREPSPDGAKITQWRALLNVTNSQPSPFVGYDNAANLVSISEQDVFSPYFPVAEAGRVTQDSVDIAKGYADAEALATIHTLNQCMVQENRALIGGLNYPLGTPPAPTVAASATGGTIPLSTAVNVKVAARSGANYYWGGSTIASAQGTVTTGAGTSTNSATASIAAVKGAVAYDWYVAGFYYTTTSVASVLITSIPTANQALPSPLLMPNLFSVAPAAVPAADSSAPKDVGGNLASFNGVIASIVGDYGAAALVTPGTGTASNSTFIDNGAGALTLSGGSISQIDSLFMGIWQAVQLSPERLVMSAQQAQDIASKVIGSPAATLFLEPQGESGKRDITAGGFVGHIVNKAAGGAVVDVWVDPHWPNGTIWARTDNIPFPGANIDAAWKVRTLRDYARYDYGTAYTPTVQGGGPRRDFEVRSLETLTLKAPTAQGLLTNIAAG